MRPSCISNSATTAPSTSPSSTSCSASRPAPRASTRSSAATCPRRPIPRIGSPIRGCAARWAIFSSASGRRWSGRWRRWRRCRRSARGKPRPAIRSRAMADFAATIRAEAAAAWALIEAIGDATREGPGITRAAFGAGEQLAAERLTDFVRGRRLPLQADPFGNLHIILAGEDPALPAIGAGSHMDSVPQGGNYDGLAGTVAAIAVLAAVQASGLRPRHSLRAIAMGGEEGPWFGTAYVGARLMLGRSTLEQIGSLTRFDSGLTLAEHLAALGLPGAPGAVLGPADLAA